MSYLSRHGLATSESVSEGHSDKICDQIADAILDAYLERDPEAHVACECLIKDNHLIIGGEITSTAQVDKEAIARRVVQAIGYDREAYGLHYQSMQVQDLVGMQSREISHKVEGGGAGDQGLMYGYATSETPERMPLVTLLAHDILRLAAEKRHSGALPKLRPDAKSQVTLQYIQGRPQAHTVVLSHQHDPDWSQVEMANTLMQEVIHPVLQHRGLDTQAARFLMNPAGTFAKGGPAGDCGLTGRKIIVDTYGGCARHGGGAFSGKDPSKVDRSAAYMARYIACHLVEAGIAHEVEVCLSYVIGYTEPVSVSVDVFGEAALSEMRIAALIPGIFDLTPAGIVQALRLKRGIYAQTACYGHFGRGFAWDTVDPDIVERLRQAARGAYGNETY